MFSFVKHFLFKLFKPTVHVMHQQFNIQQLYALPTLYLCHHHHVPEGLGVFPVP